MTATEKNIVDAYFTLLEKLSFESKTELIERLKKTMKSGKKSGLEKSFGGWKSSKSPEEIIDEINRDLRFDKKPVDF